MTKERTVVSRTMEDIGELLSLSLSDAKALKDDLLLFIDDIDRRILELKKLKMGYFADLRDIRQHISVLTYGSSGELEDEWQLDERDW